VIGSPAGQGLWRLGRGSTSCGAASTSTCGCRGSQSVRHPAVAGQAGSVPGQAHPRDLRELDAYDIGTWVAQPLAMPPNATIHPMAGKKPAKRGKKPSREPAPRAAAREPRPGGTTRLSISLPTEEAKLLAQRARRVYGGNVSRVISEALRYVAYEEGRDALIASFGRKGKVTRAEAKQLEADWGLSATKSA
jgi:hypothetical protein